MGLLFFSCVCVVVANPNGLGLLPPRGWNTWCTGASCYQGGSSGHKSLLHDNCSEALIKDVATEMIANGMQAAGWDHINMDVRTVLYCAE